MSISPDLLRDVREYLNLTQAGLAERLGVSPRTIVNWEATGVPTRSERKLRRTLGTVIEMVARIQREAQATPGADQGHLSGREIRQRHMIARTASRDETLVHARSERKVQHVAEALEDFDSFDLLHELIRRQRIIESFALGASRDADVEDDHVPEDETRAAERWPDILSYPVKYSEQRVDREAEFIKPEDFLDEDFDVTPREDLAKKDVTLVAKKGRKAADQPHAE